MIEIIFLWKIIMIDKFSFNYKASSRHVAAITMLYKITKVRSPGGETNYFDIVAGLLQGDKLSPYMFIICLEYVLRMSIDLMKENGFKLVKERSRRYPTQTITDWTMLIAYRL